VTAVGGFCWFVWWPVHTIPALEPVDEYVWLDQGWGTGQDTPLRQRYYFTAQGTSMPQGASAGAVRYDWFVNLEQPLSKERFADPAHMRKYRFLVDPEPTEANPHQLPIGFTRHFDPRIGEHVLDITCAACHTGEIHHTRDGKTRAIRIDGGQAMHAFTDMSRGGFAPTLLASLINTRVSPGKFDRFAKKVLGDGYPDAKPRLRAALTATITAMLESGQNNPLRKLYPVHESATVDVYDPTGRRIGILEARVPVSRLVPVSTGFSAGAGTILQVVDRSTGVSLLPVPFDASLTSPDEFNWQGERWLSVRTSLRDPAVDLVVSAPVTPFAEPFESAGRRGLAGLAAVLGIVLIVTTLLTRQTTQSLRSLADAAAGIAQGEYDRVVPVRRDDEVGRVASAFNAMARSLRRTLDELAQRQSFAAVGEFAASLAHEVRNPLTSIRLDLQRLEERVAGEPRLIDPVSRALRAVVRLDATVTGALRVARSGRLTLDRLDIREPIETAIRDIEVECRARGVALTRNGSAPNTTIEGDRSALHQLFLNLLLNAAQAIDSGGTIHIAIEGAEDHVTVNVSDTGSGIAADVRRRRRAIRPGSRGRFCRTRSTPACRASRASKRRSTRATRCRASSPRRRWCVRPRASSISKRRRSSSG
jgi:signal transduction histidine kinase